MCHTQPATIVMQYSRHAYETHAYLLTYFAVTLSMYTLILTVYRALLKSAVSGTDHRIQTTKGTPNWDLWFHTFELSAQLGATDISQA